MNPLKRVAVIPLLLLLVCACTVKLSRDQQMLWAVNVWDAQYEMYLDQVIDPTIVPEDRARLRANPEIITEDMIRPGLTEDEREILRKKKRVLMEAKKFLDMADAYRERGEVPPAELANNVTNLINSLIGD